MNATAETHAPAKPTIPRWWVICAALGAGFLSLVVARFTHPGIGPDAASYIGVANSIREGNGIGFWLEDPLVTWPPLWPIVIAGATWVTTLRPDIAGLVVNAIVVGLCVIAANSVAARVLSMRSTRIALIISLGISPMLIALTALVQTEITLILVTLIVMITFMRYVERDQPGWLILGGVATAVAFYARYQALYVVPMFAAWLAIRALCGASERTGSPIGLEGLRSTQRWVRAIRDVALYSVPAVGLAGVWILRNVSGGDPPLGPRFPSDVGPLHNTIGALATTFRFVTSIPEPPSIPAAVVTFVGLVVAVVWLVRRTAPEANGQSLVSRTIDAATGWVGLLVVFTGGFTVLMIISRSLVGFDDLSIRLLSPCLVPTAMLLLRYVEVMFPTSTPAGASAKLLPELRPAGRAVVGVWLGAQVVAVLLVLGPANSVIGDYGFNAPKAVAAAGSAAIDELPDGCVAYSNNFVDLYGSGFEALQSPRKYEYKSAEPTDDVENLLARIRDGEQACLVWVEYTDDPYFFDLDELSEDFVLVELGSGDGVTTYEMLAP